MINAKLHKITNAHYHDINAIGSSALKVMATKTPAHYLAYITEPRETTPAMEFGTAVHAAILEPESFKDAYAIKPENMSFATKEGKEWKAAQSGKTILTSDEHNKIKAMLNSVMVHPIGDAIANGDTEESFLWKDEKTGLLCKCRPDCLFDDMVLDVKTTDDASPKGFQQAIAKYNYHIQAAYYLEGLAACMENPPKRFVFVAIEKTAPYSVGVYELDSDALDRAKKSIRGALEMIKTCSDTKIYPGYNTKIQTIDLPYWAM